MNIGILFAIIWLHFLGDFVLQTDEMAMNKSKSNRWLSLHVFVYLAPMMILGLKFAFVNAIFHWLVDWVTSRMTSKLWAQKRQHEFFVVIGLDQAIHLTTLIFTISLIR